MFIIGKCPDCLLSGKKEKHTSYNSVYTVRAFHKSPHPYRYRDIAYTQTLDKMPQGAILSNARRQAVCQPKRLAALRLTDDYTLIRPAPPAADRVGLAYNRRALCEMHVFL